MEYQVSEWVSLGHPDKIADYISEFILDRFIERDPFTRYALEVQIKDNFVTLGGEITSAAQFSDEDIARFVREAIAEIGYTKEYQDAWGKENAISCDDIEVTEHIGLQSSDISQGVDMGGWGDQGIMFGMAVDSRETWYMPMDIYLARRIGKQLYDDRISGLDIKTQVYLCEGQVETVIVAIPLLEDFEGAGKEIVLNVVRDSLPGFSGELIVNGTGRYVKHSSIGDCGTTGRKLAVDFYGGNCNIGGGSPWTKDGTKADLALNLYARKKAVEYVQKSNEPFVKCSIACCIGDPMIDVALYNAAGKVLAGYRELAPPKQIIEMFGLRRPIYAQMCRNGMFYA